MSLMQLLSVGRSFGSVKDRPTAYRMRQQHLLPRFRGPVAPGEEALTPSARPQPAGPVPGLTVTPTGAPVRGEKGRDTAAAWVHARRNAGVRGKPGRPRGRWAWLTRWWWGRSAGEGAGGPVQAELALDLVQVVRNDLTDADLEVVARKREAADKGRRWAWFRREAGAASESRVWSRVLSRCFGVKRGQEQEQK